MEACRYDLQVQPGYRIGVAYSMESHIGDMKGDGVLTAVDAVAGQIALPGTVKIRDFQTPAQLNLGISHQIGSQWLLAADLSRIFWEDAMEDIDLGFVADSGQNIDILLPQNYKDQTTLSLGRRLYDRKVDATWRGTIRISGATL